MDDKRMDEIERIKKLKSLLEFYKTDLEATNQALLDKRIDYQNKRELENDLIIDRKQILNIEKQLKMLELGKVIK